MNTEILGRIKITQGEQTAQPSPRPVRTGGNGGELPPTSIGYGEYENWGENLRKFIELWETITPDEVANSITSPFPNIAPATTVLFDKGVQSGRRLTALTFLLEQLHTRPEELPDWYSTQRKDLDRVLPARLPPPFADFLTRVFDSSLLVRTPAQNLVPLAYLGIDPKRGEYGIFDPNLKQQELDAVERRLLVLDQTLIDTARRTFTGINPDTEQLEREIWRKGFLLRVNKV